jgi:hypothetical protein
LDDILAKHSDGKKLLDSALNEEARGMVRSNLADALLERLKTRFFGNFEASREVEKEFEEVILRTWREPIELLDLLLSICYKVSSDFISNYGGGSSSKQAYVQRALAGLQANACLVFDEILHLLKSGFPNGAASRWRTLHELTCLSYFVSKHGDDVAKRFLDYDAVEVYFQVEAISEHKKKIECASLSKKDFEAVKKDFKAMKKIYGADFTEKLNYPYGWIPVTLLKTRSFREIEKSVGLDTFRSYYDLAGYNVHGGQSEFLFKLGIGKSKSKHVVIPGPSNYGLAEPGKSAAISLGQVTACLLMSESHVKRLVVVEALRNLVDEICDAFSRIEAEFAKGS